MKEFDIIETYFAEQKQQRVEVALGIGDDCALVQIPDGMLLALSMDTLVAGVHFPISTKPFDIGYKSLAVNLSDLAAMGAEPAWVTLSLTIPSSDPAWLAGFAQGFFSLAQQYRVELIGGDTTRGPLSITVQAHGFVPHGLAMKRSCAKRGDLIIVTGDLGLAGLALQYIKNNKHPPTEALQKLNRPVPCVAEGLALRGIAHAMIDISDGLVSDLGHIVRASQCGARIWVEKLPLHSLLQQQCTFEEALQLALTAGDDYELCYTVAPDKVSQCPGTVIGEITDEPGIQYLLNNGTIFNITQSGYEHFRR